MKYILACNGLDFKEYKVSYRVSDRKFKIMIVKIEGNGLYRIFHKGVYSSFGEFLDSLGVHLQLDLPIKEVSE